MTHNDPHLWVSSPHLINERGESRKDILETMEYLNRQKIQGIKLQLLHVLKGTDLAQDYLDGKFSVYSMEEYLDTVIDCLEHLSPDIVIHRLTGDGPKDLLIAPLWSSKKRTVLNALHHECKMRGAYQGTAIALALTGAQLEHFMAQATPEQTASGMQEGKYEMSYDPWGLLWGEAGRAWSWAILEDRRNDLNQLKGMVSYTDV